MISRLTSSSALRVLRHRDFLLFFSGNFLSNCGTWFQNIAQSLLVYRLTGSVFLVGVVNFAQFAGVVLLAPWAGAAADRFDRRYLVIATQTAALLITGLLAILAAAGLATVAVVVALAALLGIVTAFTTPAMQALVPQLVPPEDIGPAITMVSVTFNLARAIGPVLGALVVTVFGIAWAFGLNSISFAALIAAMFVIRLRDETAGRPSGKARFRDSVQLVARDVRLIGLLAVVAAVSFPLDPVTTLSPAFATRIFHHADTLTGAFIGAFGTGAVLAAMFASGNSNTPYRRIVAMLALLMGGMVVFAVSPTVPIAMIALGAAGFGYLSSQTRATTLLQTSVDNSQRGRVMAIWGVCFLGTRPLASLLDGALAQLFGPRIAVFLIVLPAAAAALLLWRSVHLPSRIARL